MPAFWSCILGVLRGYQGSRGRNSNTAKALKLGDDELVLSILLVCTIGRAITIEACWDVTSYLLRIDSELQ